MLALNKLIYRLLLICIGSLAGCQPQERPINQTNNTTSSERIQKNGAGYQLYRNGKPFFIKGAGGYTFYDRLREMGGNSVRVWDTSAGERVLNQAHEQGLSVMMGIWLMREKEGFNFFDKEAVEQLKLQVREEVLRYRHHPALLMWCIGNEMELGLANVKGWRVLNEIAAMIHELDPNHPTTTAMISIEPQKIRLVKNLCPHIDVLSFNKYAGLMTLADDIQNAGWDGPFIISEYGQPGYWETWFTDWGMPIELSSSQKAQQIRSRYKAGILAHTSRCLGSYAFYWGQKQECTPTWFSIFTETGEKTAVADMLQYLWSRRWPANRAPHLASIQLQTLGRTTINRLQPGTTYSAQVKVQDPEGDSLRYHWEVLPESNWHTLDGSIDKEVKPTPVSNVLAVNNTPLVQLTSPLKPGPYRLFAYVYDGKGSVATANIAFLVEADSQSVSAL